MKHRGGRTWTRNNNFEDCSFTIKLPPLKNQPNTLNTEPAE